MILLVLFLVFVLVPAVEIALFVEVGGWIGIWPTLFVTFGTAAAGSVMLRVQGMSTLRRAQASVERDEPPVRELIDGVCLLLAGLLLLIPGFATDTIGLLLFVPPFRRALGRRVWCSMQARRDARAGGPRGQPRREAETTIIEGEYEEVEESQADLPPPDEDTKWGRR